MISIYETEENTTDSVCTIVEFTFELGQLDSEQVNKYIKWLKTVISALKEITGYCARTKEGGCGRQNNVPFKDVHILVSRTCEYVRLYNKE